MRSKTQRGSHFRRANAEIASFVGLVLGIARVERPLDRVAGIFPDIARPLVEPAVANAKVLFAF